jgi:hypothetical protein
MHDNINKSKTNKALPADQLTMEERLKEFDSLPLRNPILHWGAFALSVLSLIILSVWVFGSRASVRNLWIWVDIGLGVVLAFEFFTRSGFRWGGFTYFRTRFFDFIAIVPALALVNHGLGFQEVWVWIILAARAIRVLDRLLGDGFVRRNTLAIVEGFEEEITDRVLDRIVTRIQWDMDQAHFSHGVAESLVRNRDAVLKRVRAATPHEGFVPALVHIVGLDQALERAEERTYDAVVQIIDSEEVDSAVRDAVSSLFSGMRAQLGTKTWRSHLGVRRRRVK